MWFFLFTRKKKINKNKKEEEEEKVPEFYEATKLIPCYEQGRHACCRTMTNKILLFNRN
jgi:hypothetical protein